MNRWRWGVCCHSALSREFSPANSRRQLGLSEYGPNRLPQKPPVALWQIVLRQFTSPLIYILALAAVVSLAIGDVKDAAFIVGVLVLNAMIGAYQELRACFPLPSDLNVDQVRKIRSDSHRS